MGVLDINKARAEIYYNGQLADFSQQASANFFKGSTIRTGQVAYMGVSRTRRSRQSSFLPVNRRLRDVGPTPRPCAEAQYLYNGGAGNAVGAANPNIDPLPPSITPITPSAQPVVYYKFDGNLNNSGTGGAVVQRHPDRRTWEERYALYD